MTSTGVFGSTSGTYDSPGTMAHTTTVTKILGYGTSSLVYGIKLYWGSSNKLFGQTNGATAQEWNISGDPCYKVEYETVGGKIAGLKFTNSTSSLSVGNVSSLSTAFDNVNYVLTDMESYKGSQDGTNILWGAGFYYVDTSSLFRRLCPTPPAQLAWPALALMAHTAVVAKSLTKVGKLRGTLGIKAPSCDPPLTTSPSDAQLWYRTFRAQENCKEMFLVYLPSILVASTMGYQAFGKWVPRVVGTLGFFGAYFRYRYLLAYIEDADKRGKPFYYANMCMRPIFILAVVSSGYTVGQELYKCIKKGCFSGHSVKSEEEERDE